MEDEESELESELLLVDMVMIVIFVVVLFRVHFPSHQEYVRFFLFWDDSTPVSCPTLFFFVSHTMRNKSHSDGVPQLILCCTILFLVFISHRHSRCHSHSH